MRGLHRGLVTGAFSGLAAASLAASAAFACTPEARVRVRPPADETAEVTVAEPEQEVVIDTDNFYPSTEDNRGWDAGEVVVTLEAKAKDGFETPLPRPLGAFAPLDGAEKVILPAADELESGYYSVVAKQFGTSGPKAGKEVGTNSTELAVTGGQLVRKAVAITSPPITSPPITSPPITSPPVSTPPSATATPPGPVPTGGPGFLAAQPGDFGSRSGAGFRAALDLRQPSSSSSGSGEPGRGNAAPAIPDEVLANIPAIPGSDAAKMRDRLAGLEEPATGELWSGLDPNRAPSLLDAGALAEDGSGFPVGGVLLGSGALALAAVAAFEGRRRLAVSRVTRR